MVVVVREGGGGGGVGAEYGVEETRPGTKKRCCKAVTPAWWSADNCSIFSHSKYFNRSERRTTLRAEATFSPRET